MRFRARIKKDQLYITFPLLRILFSLIIFLAVYLSKSKIALALFVITALISFLGDRLIKKPLFPSQLSNILDPFSDKLLVSLTAVALYFGGILPLWIMAVYLSKDILMILGGAYLLYKNPRTLFRRNALDKLSLFFQIIALMAIMLERIDYILLSLSAAFVVISFISAIIRSEIRFYKRRTDFDELRFRSLITPADVVTLLNIVSGFAGILFALNDRIGLSAGMLLASVLFDYLDGKVARFTKRGGEFGKQLDSLADTVSFGIAPAIFGYIQIQTSLAIIAFIIFLFSGILRLARYNIMNTKGEFIGMPITLNGVIIPIVFFLSLPAAYYPYLYIILGLLMVSGIKVKKMF